MVLDLDTLIFVVFLVVNLAVGLFCSRGIKSTTEYAIGRGGFPVSTVATTVAATYIGASFLTTALAESYRQGLYFIIPVLGEPISLIITGYILIPRMIEFIGSTSVAETMGKFYGKSARIITAIAGTAFASGIVALQFKVAASIMQIFGISSFYSLALSATTIVMYSSFGGIKAVTFTDLLQFFTFSVVVPLIYFTIWKTLDGAQVIHTLSNNSLFDFKEVFDINNPRFLPLVLLFLYFAIPIGMTTDPAYIQRISMSRGVSQAKRSFIIAGSVSLVLLLMICGTSILLLSNNPDLDPDNLLTYVIDNYTYIGFKGLTAICIMSVVMSTADSYINSASVLMSHDVIEVLNIKPANPQKQLLLLRIVSYVVGIVAFIFAYKGNSLFSILMMTLNFYMPIVSVPLMLAIFGFRSNTKVALIGMISGGITAIFWSDNGAIPGMLANLITFIIAYFISGKPNGLISSQYKDALTALKQSHNQHRLNLLRKIQSFSFMAFCRNIMPQKMSTHMLISSFVIFSTLFSTFLLSYEARNEYGGLLNMLYHSVLIVSFVIFIYPIYLPLRRQEKFMTIFWSFAIPYMLIFVPILFVMISKFAQFQVIMLLLNITILALLIRWQVALVMFALGSLASISFYQSYEFVLDINTHEIELQFKVICTILILSSVLIAFLKPKQEAYDLSAERADSLSHTVEDQKQQIIDLSNLKQVFLRNIQHETNTPLTGVYSMSQALNDCYDRLNEEQRKNAIHTIMVNSERLISYVKNVFDVSRLISIKPNINMRKTNLSSLVYEILRKCKKLYIPREAEEDRKFMLNIESNVIAECDEYYLRRSFENLIINAIQYCKKGTIEISLRKSRNQEQNKVIFSVKDSGIGIPEEEMSSIFEPFATSSKTTTPAGGRGIGLALVKEVAQMHGGSVNVESDGLSGSSFTMILVTE